MIVGASFDSVEAQKNFVIEQGFNFPLISDSEKEVGQLYHAARPDDDPAFDFSLRISYLISPEGLVAAAWDQDSITNFAEHGDQVLAEIKSQS